MRTLRWLVTFCLFSLLTLPATAQVGDLSGDGLGAFLTQPAACGATSTGASETARVEAPLLFYAIPEVHWIEGENRVEVRVWVDGALYASERHRPLSSKLEAVEQRRLERALAARPEADEDARVSSTTPLPESTVFELLAERAEIRAELHRIAAEHRVEVEVLVNGAVVDHVPFEDFAERSALAVESHGLPVPVTAWSQVYSTHANSEPGFLENCGNGICDEGEYPGGEDCESCPEDCDGPCILCGNGYCGPEETCSSCVSDCGSCPSCPEDLGTEERTDYLGSVSYATQCRSGVFGTMYYTYQRNDYKRYTVQRTRECNGSITETVVPGSTSYFSTYCYRREWVSCSYPVGSAYPAC